MSRKRKEQRKPQRLTDFFSPNQRGGRQDGAAAASTPDHTTRAGRSELPCGAQDKSPPGIMQTPSPSSASGSPAKARPRLDREGSMLATSPRPESGDDTRELPDSIESFPTAHQPVIDTVMKDMLLSLRSSLQSDMMQCMHRFHSDLQAVETRVEHIEHKMGEYAVTINDLVDSHEEREGDTEWIKAKLADIEDRNRRNNMKVRGVPESVLQSDLRSFASSLFKELLPDLSDLELTVDRIHRLPKPAFLPEQVPRDIILRFHFFHAKEQLMAVMRKKEKIPSQYQNLQFFADLSQYTLQKRRNLNTITKALRNHKIIYRWGYPAKLSVTREGHTHIVDTLEKGISLLEEWGILPEEADAPTPPSRSKASSDPMWKTVTNRNARSHN